MTEDMRERGVQSKWNELFVVETEGGEWIDMAGEGGWSAFSLLSEAQEIADSEDEPCKIVRFVRQAALSSAGTSGTVRCSFCHKEPNQVEFVISTPNDYARAFICSECVAVCNSVLDEKRGESLSGKGEATGETMERTTLMDDCRQAANFANTFKDAKPEVLKEELGKLHRACPGSVTLVSKGITTRCTCECHASAPDRAKELARALDDEAERIVSNCACATQLDELRDEEHDTYRTMVLNVRSGLQRVASLLRREMGRRWIPVSERLPDTNEAGVSSVFFWVTSEDGWQFGYYRKDAEGECWESERSDAYNEPYTYSTEQVSYWLPESALPAPPREEG